MGFGFFGLIFSAMFVFVIGIFIATAFRSLKQWNKNNNSPRLTVDAKVVAKRMDVSHHNHANAGDATGAHGWHTTSSTYYYVTFEVESGDRMELSVSGSDYGLIAEGDKGRVSFQGTRFLGFERNESSGTI